MLVHRARWHANRGAGYDRVTCEHLLNEGRVGTLPPDSRGGGGGGGGASRVVIPRPHSTPPAHRPIHYRIHNNLCAMCTDMQNFIGHIVLRGAQVKFRPGIHNLILAISPVACTLFVILMGLETFYVKGRRNICHLGQAPSNEKSIC